MPDMPDFKSPEFVWLGLVSLFQFAQKYTAALKAYGGIFGDEGAENAFIDTSHEALWRQLMSELSKIYDRAQTCGSDNLSINMLRNLCLEHPCFTKEENNATILALDGLQTRYEELLSKNLRNKKLAHYDLISAFTQEAPAIPFSKVEQFVIDTGEALAMVGNNLFFGELLMKYEELAKVYQKDLRSLMKTKTI